MQLLQALTLEDMISKVALLIPALHEIKRGEVSSWLSIVHKHAQCMQVSECLSFQDFSRKAVGKLSMHDTLANKG